MYQELNGRRVIIWLRCSTSEQASTSLADQETAGRAFADQNGISIVDVLRLEGLSASVPKNIEREVARLIARKRLRNDFDGIMVYDPSRFTRTPPKHAMRMLDDLDAAGIPLIPVMGYTPRNDFTDMSDVYAAFVSREHAKRIGASAARGNQSSLTEGRRAHCGVTPFALDKIILSSDARPVHRLRSRANGEQWRLHPETGEIMEVFPPNQSGRSSNHFAKTKEQKIQLVAGDPDAVAVVQRIYRESLLERKGLYCIAKGLNDDAIPSPTGRAWAIGTVRRIVNNTVYTGQGICNRETFAIYYMRSPNMPAPTDSRAGWGSGRPTRKTRPRNEWMIMTHPALVGFLGEDVRSLARQRHDAILDGATARTERAGSRDKHGASPFILKGMLTTLQGGHTMSGISTGKKGKKYRYYGVHKGFTEPRTGSIFAARLPAEPIENAVRIAVRQMLLTAPLRRDAVIEQTLVWQRDQRAGDVDRRAIEKELAQIESSIDFLIGQVGNLGKEEAARRMEKLIAKKQTLKAKLAPVEGWDLLSRAEVEAVVDEVLSRMEDIGRDMALLPLIEQRRILEMFLESAVVNLETKETDIVIRLPSWAAAQQRERGEVGLDSATSSKTEVEANHLCFARIEMRLPFLAAPRRRKAA